MKRLIMTVCFLLVFVPQGLGHAGAKEDYEQAYKIYVAAGACMSAYSDRYGQLANKYLEQEGWRLDHYEKAGGSVDARFLLASKVSDLGQPMFVLAFVGTENVKDMQANLKWDKVYFAGTNLEEFAENAAKPLVPATEPKVHRGFHEFVQAGLTVKTQDADGESHYLSEILAANQDRKIYLVGHSRGGAAATLAGARLVSMGVKPEQIEIITFGAPAIGNAAFAARFEPVLNLTRIVISGDPVTGVLQTLVGGYKQFGREILWESTSDQAHDITEYADLAMKHYYDARFQAEKAGIIRPADKAADGAGGGRTFIAPLKNSLQGPQAKEFWYIEQALKDEYRRVIPRYVFADGSAANHLLKRAAQAGCKWLVVPEVGGYQLKDERNVYFISLMQTVYDVTTGEIVKTELFSTGTYSLTPLEAFIHVSKGMDYDWLTKK
ncbi:MAG: DUF2974 domain-containing protein [Negativicutes bacterium]|nr:DUF2974 domain-containing protein [Negativicutes bacterium]